MDQEGFTVWLTGLSGSGKSTLAEELARELKKRAMRVEVLDGDVIRANLSNGLGFSKEDRDSNIRRIGWVCEVLNRHGVIAIVAAISPYRAARDDVRARIKHFIEVFVNFPLEEAARSDVKGLYAAALAGDVPNFTGVSDPYEPPLQPGLACNTADEAAVESIEKMLTTLKHAGLIEAVPIEHSYNVV